MCGRFSLRAKPSDLARLFDLADVPLLAERYNVAPAQPVAVVREDGGTRALALLRWGLVPAWSQAGDRGAGPINARSETADQLPTFRHAFRKRRCLILADGFYEWAGAKGGPRRPFHFRLRDGRPFAFAGLWERWEGDDGELLETCCILTTAANEIVRPVRERMPVILGHGDFGAWLDSEAEVGQLKGLLRPYAGGDLQAVAVSPWVNSARHEGPRCLRPADAGPPGRWDAQG